MEQMFLHMLIQTEEKQKKIDHFEEQFTRANKEVLEVMEAENKEEAL
jgi:hypothetical protein